jgi:hypothetical protein
MRDLIQEICFWGIVVCSGLSVWPFRFSRRWKSWNLYLPVAGLLIYGVYEAVLPAEVDILGKMKAVVPLLLFLWLNGMAKVGVLAALQEKAGGSRRRLRALPQRRLQVLLALLIAAGCAGWLWSMLA